MRAGDASTVLSQFLFSVSDVGLDDLMKQHALKICLILLKSKG